MAVLQETPTSGRNVIMVPGEALSSCKACSPSGTRIMSIHTVSTLRWSVPQERSPFAFWHACFHAIAHRATSSHILFIPFSIVSGSHTAKESAANAPLRGARGTPRYKKFRPQPFQPSPTTWRLQQQVRLLLKLRMLAFPLLCT